MNANTSPLTPAATAATPVTAVALCRYNPAVAAYLLKPATPSSSRTFLGVKTTSGGNDLSFQLSHTMVSADKAEPAAAAFARMTRSQDLSTETVVVELAAPSITPGEVKATGIDPDDMPRSLPVTLQILAPASRHSDVAAWLVQDLPPAHAKLVFLSRWIEMERLKPNLAGLELRGWFLLELDAIVLFDKSVFESTKVFFRVKEAVLA